MRRILPLAIVAIAFSCTTTSTPAPATRTATTPAAASASSPLIGPHGFDLAGMDRSLTPCDDFYDFAVGKWRTAHPLPPQYSRFGRFEEVAERNREILHKILQEDAASSSAGTAAAGSAEQKVGDFYAACMNETAINAAGISPIQDELNRIASVSDRAALFAEIARLQSQGDSPLFRVGPQNDFKNSRAIVASLGPGQLGLPDRDYYLRPDDRFVAIRIQYVDHMTKMFTLAGEEPAQARKDADHVLWIEMQLAQAEMPRVAMRNPENRDHMIPLFELKTMVPTVDWKPYLAALGVNETVLNVTEPTYMQAVNQLLTSVPLEIWKTLLKWNLLNSSAQFLSAPFEEEEFNFNGRTLSGQKEQQERWKRCVRAADRSLGQLLGQEYVRRNFTPEAKAKMNQLIDNLVSALREDIPTLSWMGAETKQAALAKLDAFQRKIGYPDKWRDYSALTIERGSYAGDVLAARRFANAYAIGRIGKPDDRNK